MEMVLVPFIYLLSIKRSTKESLSSRIYLVSFSVFLGFFFFLEILFSQLVSLNYLFGGMFLFLGCLTFFGKLPTYRLHRWLPKAHVECAAVRSAILAGLLLKLRSPSIFGFNYFLILSMVLSFIGLMAMWGTHDFKIWVAFSSITHITLVFLYFVLLFEGLYVYYFRVHTLLSAMMFFYYSFDYYFNRSRNSFYLSSSFFLVLSLIWARIPLFLSFLAELQILLVLPKLFVFFFIFLLRIFFFFYQVFVKFSWSSLLFFFNGLKYFSFSFLIYVFFFLFFWCLL